MARPAWKTLVLANIVMPCISAAVFVATALDDAWHIFAFAAAVIVFFGLTIVNLIAPAFLWRRHGARSLIPLGVFLVIGGVCLLAGSSGYTAMNSQTPLSATFLQGRTQRELESVGYRLLSGGNPDEASGTLKRYGLTADVDTAGRVVTFRYYRLRSWTRYYFAPNGLPGPLVTEPRITEEDIPDWVALRRIAAYAESGRTRGAHPSFEPLIALPIVREALGDSVLQELAAVPPRPLAPSTKSRLIAALNEQCSAENRLIENPNIGYDGPTLFVELMRVPGGWNLPILLKKLIAEGVVRVAPDGRHFLLKKDLTREQRNRVMWLNAGLLEFAFSDLYQPREYNYDQRLADRWYVWRM